MKPLWLGALLMQAATAVMAIVAGWWGFLLSGCIAEGSAVIDAYDLRIENQGEYTRKLMMGREVKEARWEVTNKGNGRLCLDGHWLHIYDDHDDTRRYEGHTLKVVLTDLNGDGRCDAFVFGTVLKTHEETGDVLSRCPVFVLLECDVTGKLQIRAAHDPEKQVIRE